MKWLLGVFIVATVAFAAAEGGENVVLKTGVLNHLNDARLSSFAPNDLLAAAEMRRVASQSLSGEIRRSFVVKLSGVSDPAKTSMVRTALCPPSSSKCTVQPYPDGGYLVFALPSEVETLRERVDNSFSEGVDFVAEFSGPRKTDPNFFISDGVAPDAADCTIVVETAIHRDEMPIRQFAEGLRAVLTSRGVRLIDVTSPPDDSAAESGSQTLLIFVEKTAPSKKGRCDFAGDKNVRLAVEIVASVPRVLWVAPQWENRVHNVNSRWITSNSAQSLTYPYDGVLDGSGEIVGVADSGLDGRSCFFYDSAVAVSVTKQPVNVTDVGHRKIVSYWSLMDAIDQDVGHGTHCSGTVLGRPTDSRTTLLPYKGVASAARELFTDIQCSTDGGCVWPSGFAYCPCAGGSCPKGDNLWPPSDLAAGLFPWTRQNGGRIHSNSWGNADTSYSLKSRSVDLYANSNRDFLILFAVGNSGTDASAWRVSGPSTAKNGISVGASNVGIDGFNYIYTNAYDWDKRAVIAANSVMSQAGCTTNPYQPVCSFYSTFDAGWKCCSRSSVCGAYSGCGCRAYGWTVDNYCCKDCAYAIIQANPTKNSIASLADFSSRGPTVGDGRIKPDFVAPGQYIVSALSYLDPANQCGSGSTSTYSPQSATTPMQGTSMATPGAAGYAALVRQYFRNFYPNVAGTTAGATPISNPPATLIKAAMINSATTMNGYYYNSPSSTWTTLSASDPGPQGFGRLEMKNIIPYPSQPVGERFFTKVLNAETLALSTGQSWTSSIVAGSCGATSCQIRVTLVWNDPAAATSASQALINNLDLSITRSGSADQWRGNEQYLSGGSLPDTKNNVERIIIANPIAGSTYVVTVTATSVSSAQDFSVVLSTNLQTWKSGCQPGTYSATGSPPCTLCAAGTKAEGYNATSCSNCTAGYYSLSGAAQCTSCSGGSYSVSGAAQCTNCTAGTYSAGGSSSCSNCTGGSYSLSGAASCTTCSAGTYATSGSAQCKNCSAGTRSDSGYSNCIDCWIGYYSLPGAPSCDPCPKGTFANMTRSASCTLCPAGTYAAYTSQTVCARCPAGQTSGEGAASCTVGSSAAVVSVSSSLIAALLIILGMMVVQPLR